MRPPSSPQSSGVSPEAPSSPVKLPSAAWGFAALGYSVLWLFLLGWSVQQGAASYQLNFPQHILLGAFLWLPWALWSVGFLLSRKRRPSVLAALAVISTALQRLRYGR